MEIKRSNPNAFKQLNARLQTLDGLHGKVGWLESAVYPDGTPVASVAAKQEFGDQNAHIPPRPFVRPAIMNHKNDWMKIAEQGAQAVLEGMATAHDVMTAVTLAAEDSVLKNIIAVVSPPLAERTLEARRSRGNSSVKPLNDTGHMIATLTSVVENAS